MTWTVPLKVSVFVAGADGVVGASSFLQAALASVSASRSAESRFIDAYECSTVMEYVTGSTRLPTSDTETQKLPANVAVPEI